MLQFLTDAAHEPTPVDDLGALGEAELGDSANLREELTGVPGVIFISTRMGQHGPRVTWYEGRADGAAPSFTVSIADHPDVVASSVDSPLLRQHAERVADWVRLNRETLTTYWNDGAGLFEDERHALLGALRPLK